MCQCSVGQGRMEVVNVGTAENSVARAVTNLTNHKFFGFLWAVTSR